MFNLDYASEDIIEDVLVYDPRDSKDYCLLPLNLSIDELDQFCLYSVTMRADSVTHSALANMKTMFEMLDPKPYRTNDSAKARLEFIKLAMEARCELNLTSKTLVVQHILRNCDRRLKDIIDQEVVKPLVGQRMDNDTCKYLNTMVFENLINGWSLTCSKELASLFERKDQGYFNRISDFSNELKRIMTKIDAEVRKSEEYRRDGKGFDLTTDTILGEIDSVMDDLNAPNNKLRTGIQFLNKMLNGGFESGRSYLFMGVTGVGKSIVLLSCALWITKYNKLPIVDGKKQAVLFISQENSKSETFERIFNMSVSGEDIRNFSNEQIVEGLKSAGLINKRSDKNSIDFIFRYFSDKEIGVSDIDALISDFDRKGIQIIAVVQDYIEKLKPKHQTNEMRFNLGNVATEMAELAKARHIPFISAAQLNRTASSIMSEAVANNKKNTTKLLGKQNVSKEFAPLCGNVYRSSFNCWKGHGPNQQRRLERVTFNDYPIGPEMVNRSTAQVSG